ncbi:aminotransferase class I/II-fold pyridoxal phosphate-dependent enzyme [Nitrosophilus kaiyonis]|uniref:aminotransferase class I/II-fold pyridoxal phosphate-dependent enzyme n=1 Tax=Nitrosophilus kaiyonis TaxID=2930200 RepID=UPI002491E5BD|nr:pyridoxal phosphate-dependent aminotransferase family protein [Nitrosophilus kaiyonis]
MYEKEINAIKRANRFRERKIYDFHLKDFASNDYLGFAHNKKLLINAYKKLKEYPINAAKASLIVNGYTSIHKNFEDDLCRLNGFEAGIVLGSGFLANIALIEALPRKNDLLLIDEEYHASGILASKLTQAKLEFFKHNDPEDLEKRLKNKKFNRVIIAIEGIYSMSGDIAKKEIFDIANRYNAILIIDEAHSSGVIGENLLGILDFYNIKPHKNYIKMGTMGKAYGSYGAYILSSSEIISFLENRAKSIIYTTALSLFDVLLAHEALKYIEKNSKKLVKKIEKRKNIIEKILNKKIESLILNLEFSSNQEVLEIQKELLNSGFLVGAIRQPTVKKPILRIIPRLGESKKDLKKLLKILRANYV